MKLNRKFTISVTAALLAVAPVTGVVSLPKTNIVYAARQSVSGKIKVTQTYASYFANGKRHPVKKGKVLKCYGTPKYKPFDPGSYYFGELQYNLGNSGLLSSDYVKQISGKNWITVINNGYLYNAKGKRLSTKIKRGQSLAYTGKVKSTKNGKYYFYENNKKKRLPYYKIKGHEYYKLGRNRYVKVADVIAVNGNYLMTTGETTGGVKNNNVRTFINSNDYSNDSTMAPSDKYLKKGQKLTFDQAVTFVSQLDDFDHDPYDYYRIKGTHLFVSADNLNLSKALPVHEFEDLYSSRVELKTKTPIYNAMGEKTDQLLPLNHEVVVVEETSMGDLNHVDEEVYLWVPSENKAELFYHVIGYPNSNTNELKDYGYIKASAVKKVRGLKLEPINTAAEAKADSVQATNKAELEQAISSAQITKKTSKYKLADYDLKVRFNAYLANTEKINANKQATVLAVKQAARELTNAEKALNGKKLKVGRYDQLTMEEVQKVLRLGYNLVKIEHRGYVLPNIYNSKNNWQYITDRPVWNFGKDSHFWLGYAASDVKNKQPLDIKEIAEESTKKLALKKLVKQYYGLKGNRFFIYNRQGKLIKKLTLKKEKIFKVKGIGS